MDLPASYHELQLQVKQKVHSITSHLVQQLMTIPSVISVQLTGHLDVIVNGCVTVSIVSPSQYLCASGGQSTCTPSGFSDCNVMNMPMNSQAANFREGGFGERSVEGVETPLKDLYGHSQTTLPAPLLNELENSGQTSTSKQNLPVGCGQTADEFLHSILSSSVLVGGIGDHQDYLDISNNTGDLAAGSLANLNRYHKKAAQKSKLASPQHQYNPSSKRSRKRKHPQKFSALGESVKNEPLSAEVTERSAVSLNTSKAAADLECATCHKIYPGNKRKAYHKHVRSHSQSTQCETCGKYLSSADSLKRHQIGMHRQEKPYRCEQCGERFSFHHSFKLHTYKHSGSRPEVCPHCSKTYLTHSHLKAHMMSAHTKKDKVQGKFQCEVCGRTLGSAASLKNHRSTHTDDKPFHCDICSKGFSYKSALLLHKKLVHVAGRKFECEICHKLFKTPQVLNIHKRRHGAQETGQFVCDICGRRFMFDSNLKAHVAAVHEGICPYTCKDCGKGFKLLSSLYSHRYTHTSERPYQCSLCPKVFKTKSACSAHERRHTASRDFECQHCGAKFPDKGGLDKHTRSIHMPSKVFECTLCGKTGSRMDNMRTHIKSHTGRDKTVEELNTYIKQVNE